MVENSGEILALLRGILDKRRQCVYRKVTGVSGGFWQSAQSANQVFSFERGRFGEGLAFEELGDGRCACYCGNTTLRQKLYFRETFL